MGSRRGGKKKMTTCFNCAWYCHADKKCYAMEIAPVNGCNQPIVIAEPKLYHCRDWQFDGCEDWMREACETA